MGKLVFNAILFILLAASSALCCTTTIVGKDASTDGSVMVSHSDDGLGDPRLIFIPAKDHPKGAKRAIYYSEAALGYEARFGAESGHRLNIKERSPYYDEGNKMPVSVPLGYIPQVEHTYAYYDANYGIMNEHQLVMGECTDKAKVDAEPEQGKRIFYSAELSRVALERCKTAREAIKLMGELIDTYGYYGTGETLLVGDPQEGWVMEMCAYDANGTDGVWVAQRVPDNSFFVAANQFRIRDIKKGAKDMMYSKNIFDVAQQKGWWKPSDGPLDFAKVYGDGEYHHPYYSLRRVWRAQSIVAPSKNLPAWVEDAFTRTYPFAITPDNKLSVQDVTRIHRDNYEGTEFDLTKELASGPFGNPNRFEGGAESTMDGEKGPSVKGAFERPLNIYRCAYSYVCQARKDMVDAIGGVVWFGSDRPANTVYMPFYAGANNAPEAMQLGDVLVFNSKSVWTTFNYMANYIMLKYSYMFKDLKKRQEMHEALFYGRQDEIEAKAMGLWKSGKKEQAKKLLTQYAKTNVDSVLNDWWELSKELYIKYNNGYLNDKQALAQPLFYPNWWLRKVQYENGPLTYKKKTDEK